MKCSLAASVRDSGHLIFAAILPLFSLPFRLRSSALQDLQFLTVRNSEVLTISRAVMSSNRWQEIYRSYTGEELEAEIAEMKKQATFYTAQSFGDKSYQKDLANVEERLHAGIRVRNERRFSNLSNVGIPDFGGLNHGS